MACWWQTCRLRGPDLGRRGNQLLPESSQSFSDFHQAEGLWDCQQGPLGLVLGFLSPPCLVHDPKDP